jgi:hypothetical protein
VAKEMNKFRTAEFIFQCRYPCMKAAPLFTQKRRGNPFFRDRPASMQLSEEQMLYRSLPMSIMVTPRENYKKNSQHGIETKVMLKKQFGPDRANSFWLYFGTCQTSGVATASWNESKQYGHRGC